MDTQLSILHPPNKQMMGANWHELATTVAFVAEFVTASSNIIQSLILKIVEKKIKLRITLYLVDQFLCMLFNLMYIPGG